MASGTIPDVDAAAAALLRDVAATIEQAKTLPKNATAVRMLERLRRDVRQTAEDLDSLARLDRMGPA